MKIKFYPLLWLSNSRTGYSRLIGAAEHCPASVLEPVPGSKQLLAHYFLSSLLNPNWKFHKWEPVPLPTSKVLEKLPTITGPKGFIHTAGL